MVKIQLTNAQLDLLEEILMEHEDESDVVELLDAVIEQREAVADTEEGEMGE